MKRTTVTLEGEDLEALKALVKKFQSSDVEAIRRSLRFTADLLEWQSEGGDIVLQKGQENQTVRFIR